tara:strand:+ start:233 stop:550 length:318 start_codon:yes stop_codon:yes gene_type:complete
MMNLSTKIVNPSTHWFWSTWAFLFGVHAITIGTSIYRPWKGFLTNKTLTHERIHVAQFLRIFKKDTFVNRIRWVLLHIKYNIIEWATAKMNPLEKEAYDNAGKPS